MLLLAATLAHAATGQQLFAACIACHGARAEGNPAVGAPALAGQSASYLQRQLRNFAAGLRGTHQQDLQGAQMRAANQALLRDDASIVAVAGYIAKLPRTSPPGPPRFNARNGASLYQGKCGACHGARAEGNEGVGAPRLAGLEAAYLKRQFNHFRLGVRGVHPDDPFGRQMAMMSTAITTDHDLDDVVGHIIAAGAGP
jgi:cytochrome c oxidase subunit 2